MDRPHILYNRFTKKYVCWLKIMEKDGTQTETVLTASDILGPYTMVHRCLLYTSVWVAMVLDWIFRAVCFIWRFAGGKWQLKKL